MTMKTTVVNTTGKVFILKEGTAGVYRLLKRLQPEEVFIITVDPNSTYREYFCAVRDNDPDALFLSSDDCQEYDLVRIKEKTVAQQASFVWEKQARDANRDELSDPTESFLGKLARKLIPGFFRRGNPQT